MNKLSIKIRVTLWYTALVMFICGILVGAIALLNENITEKAIYGLIEDEVYQKIQQLNSDPAVTLGTDGLYILNGVYLQIYTKDGKMLAGELPADFESRLISLEDCWITTRHEGEGYLCHCQITDDGEYIVRGVFPRKNIHLLSYTVLKVAIIAIPLLVLLAFAGGGFIAGQAVKPLERINNTVEEIACGNDLKKRVGMDEADDEIGTLSRNFDKMMDRLQETFEREKQFTSDASHELRTPVSVILAQCQCAIDESTDEADIEAFETIMRQARKMSAMISRLLMLSRIGREHAVVEKSRINISEFVKDMCDELSEISPEIYFSNDIEEELYVNANIELLNMAFQNLITNACRYGGGIVHIRLEGVGDKVIFSVSDKGIGIAPEELDKIWHRFYRCSNAPTNTGVGLGLSFVQEAARLNDGDAEVESILGEGSKFSVSLKRCMQCSAK